MQLNIQQGSNEWLNYRKKCITSTDSAVIMGLNPWKTSEKLLLQKVGALPEDELNFPMMRGRQLEPIARDLYIHLTGNFVSPTVHIHDEYPWAMCSTDGITFDEKLVLEIKCGKKAFDQSLDKYIPKYYESQIQHCLWVSGADYAHYFCYWGGQYTQMEVDKNHEFIEEMIEKEKDFLDSMYEMQAKFLTPAL
jgi:putative phage-type endonuclease